MSSRRTGIEDLKSDLISRVFAQAPDTEKRNVAKGLKFFQQQMSKSELSAFLKREHRWSVVGEQVAV